jgi:hypothetical protein
MKRWLWLITLSVTLLAGQAEAAKRLGGGGSFGKQSSNVTQRQATPATPAPAPTQGATNSVAKPATPAAPAAAPKKPWGAMLGGLAAGLGLAWLASSLGLGEAMGQFMMFALLALVIMVAVGWFMRRRNAQSGAPAASPFAFQGAGAGAGQALRRSVTVRKMWETTLRLVPGNEAQPPLTMRAPVPARVPPAP